MGEVDTPRLGIEGDVVKILDTARRRTERDFLEKVIARRRSRKDVGAENQQEQTQKNIRAFHAHHSTTIFNGSQNLSDTALKTAVALTLGRPAFAYLFSLARRLRI